jgi:hypothetical protein
MTSLISNFLVMFYPMFYLIKSWGKLLIYSTEDGGAGMGGGLGFDEVPKRLKRGEREQVRMALGGG